MTQSAAGHGPASSPPAQSGPALLWLRDDLRLADNPALHHAAGRPLAVLYVLDEDSPSIRPLGGAARWWLANSLRALAADLARRGVPLILRRGPAGAVVPQVARDLEVGLVSFNERPGAAEARIDHEVADTLEGEGRAVARFWAHLLHPPGTVGTSAGRVPRTFSAFLRAALKGRSLAPLIHLPARLEGAGANLASDDLSAWGLEPRTPDWAGGLRAAFTPGEASAQARLAAFLKDGLDGYAERRDRPDEEHVSRLSPHLRFGEISPRQVLFAVRHAADQGTARAADADKFEAELYWREFSHHLLAEEGDIAQRNIQGAFDAFPWREAPGEWKAWRRGLTGYPIVDAGMRQLWQTGWMHNRVRMIVASFLTKDLLMDWRAGEAWFWDTLVDADPANNPASWQWVAGCGLDAAPYFRIFNPVLQGEKFDPDGAYVRAFIPELSHLPAQFLHQPWRADAATLARAGVRLGIDYPKPIVDHAAARERALLAFQSTKK